MRNYYVICEEVCPRCNGTQKHASPLMDHYLRDNQNGLADMDDRRAWLTDNGYPDVSPVIEDGEWEPVACACGYGRKEYRVDLAEALRRVIDPDSNLAELLWQAIEGDDNARLSGLDRQT